MRLVSIQRGNFKIVLVSSHGLDYNSAQQPPVIPISVLSTVRDNLASLSIGTDLIGKETNNFITLSETMLAHRTVHSVKVSY